MATRAMTDPFFVLLVSAATLGTIHTAIGVDHSLPFIVLSKTRNWTLSRTLGITLLCGLGHVLSSVAIASIGLGLGVAGSRLSFVEETRGTWAAWLLVGFGIVYAAVAWWKTRNQQYSSTADWHHEHTHGQSRCFDAGLSQRKLTPALFVIFLLGPCEALLPLLTASGITLTFPQSLAVTLVFCVATVSTMLTLVAVGFLCASTSIVQHHASRWTKHSHALAGLALAASGVSIQALGI
jgi:hypothetical protein